MRRKEENKMKHDSLEMKLRLPQARYSQPRQTVKSGGKGWSIALNG